METLSLLTSESISCIRFTQDRISVLNRVSNNCFAIAPAATLPMVSLAEALPPPEPA